MNLARIAPIVLVALPLLGAAYMTSSRQSTSAASAPVAEAGPTIVLQFTEDVDASGGQSSGDAIPAQLAASVSAWSHAADFEIVVLSDPSGRITLQNLPPDGYTLRVYWPGGFVSPGAGPQLPNIWRDAFVVTATGDVVAPDPLPRRWPGLSEPFSPDIDRPVIGPPPSIIALGKKNPHVLGITTDLGFGGPVRNGVADVAADVAEHELVNGTHTDASSATPILAVATVAGRIVVDANGDGVESAGDQPGGTLVELVPRSRGVFSLLTAADGTYTFENMPDGSYTLWVWWPGFVDLAAAATNPALYVVDFVIAPDGSIDGAIPSLILVKANSAGVIPYPVRAGGDGVTTPTGRIDGRKALGFPRSGDGSRTEPSAYHLLAALLGLSGLGTLLVARIRARHT